MNVYGGIDFNSTNLDLQIKRDGHGVPLPINQQDLEHINIDGLVPIIINIRPATSLTDFKILLTLLIHKRLDSRFRENDK